MSLYFFKFIFEIFILILIFVALVTEPDLSKEQALPVGSVDDFVPDTGTLDDSFLDDTKEIKDVAKETGGDLSDR